MGTLAGGLGCFPLDHGTSLPRSHSRARTTAFVVWFGLVSGKPPCRSVYATSVALLHPGAAPKCISGRTSYLRVRLAFHPYPQVIPALCNGHGFGPPRACSARFTLPMGSSPGFGSVQRDWPPFRTRFPSGSGCRCLSLATPNYSLAHSTKGTPSPVSNLTSSDRLEAHGFRICFTPLVGVLFTIPSRYWFTIGRWSYLALGGGPPSFPPNVTCWAVLTSPDHWRPVAVDYGTLTLCGVPFQHPSSDAGRSQRGVSRPLHLDRTTPERQRRLARTPPRFGLCPVRSPLLRASSLFLRVLRCFSSPGSLPPYREGDRPSRLPGCPIRRSRDRRLPAPPPSISSRGHVLHRRPAPRHPPCAHHSGRSICGASVHPARLVPCRDIETKPALPALAGQDDVLLSWTVVAAGHSNAVLVPHLPTRLVPGGPIVHRPIALSRCGTAGGAAGARTPNLRRARAALSRLSYDPRSWAGGRTWTRTRDLGLIRAAL